MSITHLGRLATAALAVATVAAPLVADAGGGKHPPASTTPRLAGRAVLPVDTYAPGPSSGHAMVPAGQTTHVVNGYTFPTRTQPVEGFSGIVAGRRAGEFLVMADNGYGGKATSTDFLIRAYHVTPDFKTAEGGTGGVAVGSFVQFSDPYRRIGFPIVRERTAARWLTGGDIDPESIQRDRHGDLWVGDEFGPWLLHFDSRGRLLEPPITMPDGIVSPNNPHGGTATTLGSRGIEALAITPDGGHLVAVVEGPLTSDDQQVRRVYRYSLRSQRWTRLADYRTEDPAFMVADVQALSGSRMIAIERDGVAAAVRAVYEFDLRPQGKEVSKHRVVDLAAIPDPDLVSLPAIHEGDIGLGDPFRVACESIEALHVLSARELLLACDNNLANTGRNPGRADDNEFIVVALDHRRR